MKVLVVEKGEPGREASWAAGGMLADFLLETPPALRDLAAASARMYPEFVHELEDESRMKIDLRGQGALVFLEPAKVAVLGDSGAAAGVEEFYASPEALQELEPGLDVPGGVSGLAALFL